MALSPPLPCCPSASPGFEIQCRGKEQGQALRSQRFGEAQVSASPPACGQPLGKHQRTPAGQQGPRG